MRVFKMLNEKTNLDKLHEVMAEAIRRIYGSPSTFISAWQSNQGLVLRRVLGDLREKRLPIPYNIKETLAYWVSNANTFQADDKEVA
jgi:hypothetical protein